MRKDELAAPAAPLPTSVPVICDTCRAAGRAGDPMFSAIPDILAFTPVPRRARVDNWTAEHQRAFIAALAITGSPRQAARALGRHTFGAEQLRKAAGGKSFSEAWDAALDIARERELARIHANLSALSAEQQSAEARAARPTAAAADSGVRAIDPNCDYDPDIHEEDYPEYWESQMAIRHKLTRCRRLLLAMIAGDSEQQQAWETLVGPVDWDKAARLEPQDDEPFADPVKPIVGMPNMRTPDMLLVAEHGLLGDVLGGYDAMADIREALAGKPPSTGE